MIPYLLVLSSVTVTVYFGRHSGSRWLRLGSLLLSGAVLVLFAGLRDLSVGTDTAQYVREFENVDTSSIFLDQGEFGYFYLSRIAASLSDSYATLLLLIAAIVVACYMSAMVRLTRRHETALFLFIALGVYTFFFNGARQGIAAAVCFAAIPFLLERKLWRYAALVLVASTFHRTALIALPLYWLASSEVRWTRLLALGLTTAILIAFLGTFINLATTLLPDKYAQYGAKGEGGGQISAAFFAGQGAALYFLKRYVTDRVRYARLLNIYLAGLVPAVASTLSSVDPSGLLRLHLYFSQTAIVLWPMVFSSIKDPRDRLILGTTLPGITILYFWLATSTFSNLLPFSFNSILFQ